MRARVRPALALVLLLALAGCTSTTVPAQSATPKVSTTSAPSPTPTVGSAASFLLGGDELVVLDADGRTIRVVALADPGAIAAAISEVHGAPQWHERTTEMCAPPSWATWYDASAGIQLLVWPEYSTLAVRRAGLGIEPRTGPRFGESALEFTAALPEDQQTDISYLYEPAAEQPYGYPWGGVAYVDASGAVASLASPSAPGAEC